VLSRGTCQIADTVKAFTVVHDLSGLKKHEGGASGDTPLRLRVGSAGWLATPDFSVPDLLFMPDPGELYWSMLQPIKCSLFFTESKMPYLGPDKEPNDFLHQGKQPAVRYGRDLRNASVVILDEPEMRTYTANVFPARECFSVDHHSLEVPVPLYIRIHPHCELMYVGSFQWAGRRQNKNPQVMYQFMIEHYFSPRGNQ
jgi:hypothetical protein